MPTKIEQMLPYEKLREFCEKILATPGAKDSPTRIRDLAAEYGISVSKMGTSAFRDGPLARYIERIERSKATTEALVNAAAGGAHGLDAVEEAMVIELQDHIAQAEQVDLKFVTGQLLKLRMSISLREESHRKQADLERKITDSETARRNSDRRVEQLDERLKLLQLDAAKAALAHAKELRAIAGDTSTTDAEKLERARLRLFGEAPADLRPLGETHGKERPREEES